MLHANISSPMPQIEAAERQEKVRLSRQSRVPTEPGEGEQSTLVQVRHLTLGTVRRTFDVYSVMSDVYDWVGSLSLTPEHFQLLNFRGEVFLPSKLTSVHLSMHTFSRALLIYTE